MNPNPHNLSDTEIELVESIENQKSIVFLSSFERDVKYQFINAFLIESLEKGKTFVFRVKNAEQFKRELETLGLSQFALILEKDTQLKPQQISNLENIKQAEQIEAIKARISYSKEVEKIHKRNKLYTEEVFGKYPRLKLAELLYLSKRRKQNADLDLLVSSRNYVFNQAEFWEIRGEIERAAKFYKPSFSFLKTSDQFCDDIYRDFHLAENQTVVFKYLQKFIKDTEDLSTAYRKSFQRIKNQLLNKYEKHLHRLKTLLENLERQLEFYKIEEEFTPIKKKFGITQKAANEKQKLDLRTAYTMLLDELDSLNLIKCNRPPNDAQPQIEEIEAFCLEIEDYIAKKHVLVHHKVEEQLEILNANNFDAPELSEIARQQTDLIYAINGAKLLKTEIHNLSISAWKNYQFLMELHRSLVKERLFLEVNTDYAIYRSFEFTLPKKVVDIVNALSNIKNSEWVESFETWYFQALFDKYAKGQLSGIEDGYSNISQVKRQDQAFTASRILNRFLNQEQKDTNFSRKITSEGGDWKTTLLSAPGAFTRRFPIIICEEDFFSSEIANFNYNYLVCLENDEIPQSIFANSHFSSIICLHTSPISKEMRESAYASKNYKKKKVLTLKVKNIPTGSEVMSILKNKITLSKALTYVLGQSSLEKNFYSAKDFSIITCLSPFCTKLLELELLDMRIKALKYTHLESGIVEDVILKDDANKYLVLQDGYLDPSLNLEWQIQTLDRIKDAGIQILMINTERLALGKKTKILDFLNIPELQKMARMQV